MDIEEVVSDLPCIKKVWKGCLSKKSFHAFSFSVVVVDPYFGNTCVKRNKFFFNIDIASTTETCDISVFRKI